MSAGAWTLTTAFRTNLVTGALGNLTTSNALNCALVTASSNVSTSSTTYSGLTNEVSSSSTGYTTGGATNITLADSGTTSVTLTPTANITWTASTSGITANWAVLYLASGGTIVAFCQLSTSGAITVTSGNTLTITDSNPVLTVA